MARGQAERLMPLIQELLREHGVGFDDLGRIGVGIGPGNFTGIRISVSAARGLALSLEVPAIGVSGLTALQAGRTNATAAIVGPRDTAYVQTGGGDVMILPVADVPENALWLDDPAELVGAMVRLTASATPGPAPAPMYVRAADAAPSKDAPPVILE